MSDACSPLSAGVDGPDRAPPLEVLPPGEATLVRRRSPPGVSTVRGDYDARTAMTKGLQEYLQQLEIADAGGRVIRFAKVEHGQTEPEENAAFPWACVYSKGEGLYDGDRLQPSISKKDLVPGTTDTYLAVLSDFPIEITIEFVCGSDEERSTLNKLLEEELQFPARTLADGQEMYGFRLELPYYFGQRAAYSPAGSTYLDSPEEALRGRFRTAFRLKAHMATCRLVKRPIVKTKIETDASFSVPRIP